MGAVARAWLAFGMLTFTNKYIYIATASIPNHELQNVTLP